MQGWKNQGLGIQWLTLLLDNPNDATPPTTAGALAWKNNFGHTLSYVCADPGFSMVPGSSVGTPQLSIINPRTMVVVNLQEGYSGNYSQLTALAQSNM